MEERSCDEFRQVPCGDRLVIVSPCIPYEDSEEERAARWAELLPRVTFEEHPGGWFRMRIAPESDSDQKEREQRLSDF